MNQLTICLIIFVLTLVSYLLDKIPMEVTALGSMALLVLFGCLKLDVALSGFANPNVILMGAMFVVAAGFNRTQMVNKLVGLIYKMGGGSFNKMLAGYIVITAVLTQFIPSPMVVFGIVMPMVITMCKQAGVSPSKAMFPIGIVAIACCGILPFGANAIQYAKFNGFLESFKYTKYAFGFFDMFWARLPILVIVILYAIFVSPRIAPNIELENVGEKSRETQQQKPLSPVREFLGYGIFILVTLGMIFQTQVGIPTWLICFIGAVIVVGSGVLKRDEAIKSMNLWMILMYVGALAMGNALDQTGAGKAIGKLVAGALGGNPNGFVLGTVFFMVPFILTQFMMNQAVANVFTPIAILTCQVLGLNPVGPITLVTAGSLTAFFTPMATPAVPMLMASGGYKLKDLVKQGWLLAIIICVVSVVWTMILFPA